MLIYGAPLALCTPICLHHQAAFAVKVCTQYVVPPIQPFSLWEKHRVVDRWSHKYQSGEPKFTQNPQMRIIQPSTYHTLVLGRYEKQTNPSSVLNPAEELTGVLTGQTDEAEAGCQDGHLIVEMHCMKLQFRAIRSFFRDNIFLICIVWSQILAILTNWASTTDNS